MERRKYNGEQVMQIFVLNDQIINSADEFPLINFLKKSGYTVYYLGIPNFKRKDHLRRYRLPILHLKYFITAFKAVSASKKDDFIICRLDYLAIYTKFLDFIYFKNLKIIALNVMVNNKAHILKKMIFGKIFNSKNVFMTVNSKGLIDYYGDLLNLGNKNLFLVYDVCGPDILELEKTYETGDGTIFCGGYNARDWAFLYSIVKQLPEHQFIFVGKRGFMDNYTNLPNIKIYEEISQVHFFKLISDCTIIAIPLITEAPAGLIVIYVASVLSKPVIITKTLTTIDFIDDKIEGCLVEKGDEDTFIKSIRDLMNDEKLQIKYGNNLKDRIKNQCSIDQYCNSILQIIITIQKKLYIK